MSPSDGGPPARAAQGVPPQELPRLVQVHPGRARGSLRAPPSKSYTHRALLAGALANGPVTVHGPLVADDTLASLRTIGAIGGGFRTLENAGAAAGSSSLQWQVVPPSSWPPDRRSPPQADVGESGTTLRLFTAAAALGRRDVRFVGHPSLARRPMEELVHALRSIGAVTSGPPAGASLPFSIHGPLHPGKVELRGDVSSQFISALLFVLPLLAEASDVVVHGIPVSEPYIAATRATLLAQGVSIEPTEQGYHVPGGQRYSVSDLHVPGDASSAAYLLALGALTGGPVRVEGLPAEWPQADLALLEVLTAAGAHVSRSEDVVEVKGGPLPLSPFEADLDPSPDLAPLLAVLASFSSGRSVLNGGAHLAAKESDRRQGSLRLARALGAKAKDDGRTITIEGPTSARSLDLRDLRDHRMLFSAVVAASALPEPSLVGDGKCASKSNPGFFDELRALGIAFTVDRSQDRQERVREDRP